MLPSLEVSGNILTSGEQNYMLHGFIYNTWQNI